MNDDTVDDERAGRIGDLARRLLQSGTVGDEPLRDAGAVGRPLSVSEKGGRLHSWFVPVTVGGRLVAFFQMLPDGTMMRFSSFQRRSGEFDACPAAEEWLDVAHIRARAAAHADENETTREPFLTYDRTPDRLVWAVPLAARSGAERLVYVAGDAVYSPPAGDSVG
jgi:hypothetical protein